MVLENDRSHINFGLFVAFGLYEIITELTKQKSAFKATQSLVGLFDLFRFGLGLFSFVFRSSVFLPTPTLAGGHLLMYECYCTTLDSFSMVKENPMTVNRHQKDPINQLD
jgi:hypothetical protein